MKGTLTSATIELTPKCNLKCAHCNIPVTTHDEGIWDAVSTQQLMRRLTACGVRDVELTGGEPLMHPAFRDILAVVSQSMPSWSLATNGTLIDKAAAQMIASNCPRSVLVSLYGASPLHHDRVTCGYHSYERTTAGIDYLLSEGVRPQIKTTVTSLNIDQVEPVWRWCSERGLVPRYSYRISPSVSGMEFVCRNQYRLLELFKDERFSPCAWSVAADEASRYQGSICSAGRTSICISWNGDIYPCDDLRVRCGSILTDDIDNLLDHSAPIMALRRTARKRLAKCSDCNAFGITCTPCPADWFSKYGNMDGVDDTTCMFGRLFYGLHERSELATGMFFESRSCGWYMPCITQSKH